MPIQTECFFASNWELPKTDAVSTCEAHLQEVLRKSDVEVIAPYCRRGRVCLAVSRSRLNRCMPRSCPPWR